MREKVVAISLGGEIDLDGLSRSVRVKKPRYWEEPLVFRKEGQTFYVYAFGVVVIFSPKNVSPMIEKIRKYVYRPGPEVVEEYALAKGKGKGVCVKCEDGEAFVSDEAVYVPKVTEKVRRIVALVLAQSAALSRMEVLSDKVSEAVSELVSTLTEKRIILRAGRLKKLMQQVLLMRHALLSDIMVLEIPQSVWDNPEVEELYYELRKMFEIDRRYRALRALLDESLEMLWMATELLSAQRSEILELLIVLLFILEIVLAFF